MMIDKHLSTSMKKMHSAGKYLMSKVVLTQPAKPDNLNFIKINIRLLVNYAMGIDLLAHTCGLTLLNLTN